MARQLRVQFPDALYHVINRGSYRHDVFAAYGAIAAFERTLAQTCERNGWRGRQRRQSICGSHHAGRFARRAATGPRYRNRGRDRATFCSGEPRQMSRAELRRREKTSFLGLSASASPRET